MRPYQQLRRELTRKWTLQRARAMTYRHLKRAGVNVTEGYLPAVLGARPVKVSRRALMLGLPALAVSPAADLAPWETMGEAEFVEWFREEITRRIAIMLAEEQRWTFKILLPAQIERIWVQGVISV